MSLTLTSSRSISASRVTSWIMGLGWTWTLSHLFVTLWVKGGGDGHLLFITLGAPGGGVGHYLFVTLWAQGGGDEHHLFVSLRAQEG